MASRLMVLVAVSGAWACISDERSPLDSSATLDSSAAVDSAAQTEVQGETCAPEGARECVSVSATRVCQNGAWVSSACGAEESCSRSKGSCSKGQLSCLGTLVCSVDCEQGDDGCTKACSASATVPAVDALGALNACQCETDCWPILCGRLFPWPSYGEISACVADTCAAEAATCVGGGATGGGGCLAIRDCTLACRGDVFCAESCFASGTAEAQTTAAFYYMCVRKECGPDPASVCLFNAQANKCADLWAACRGEP